MTLKTYPLPSRSATAAGLELTFRSLEAADIDKVMALEKRVQSHPWRRSSYDDCLVGKHHCWLAEHDGTLVGFVVVTWGAGDAELLNIAVAPDRQRQGVGQALIDLMVDQVRPFASMIFLEVRISNHSAIAFYEREQFFELGQRPNYYPTARGREDALLLARQL